MASSSESLDPAEIKGGEYLLASAALLLGAVVFGRFMRPVLTFAAGMTAARGLWGISDGDGSSTSSGGPEWLSDHRPGPNGRLNQNQKADLASEDSFPASDPPASY